MKLSGLCAPSGNVNTASPRFLQNTYDVVLVASSPIPPSPTPSNFSKTDSSTLVAPESLSGKQKDIDFKNLQLLREFIFNSFKKRTLNANSSISNVPHNRCANLSTLSSLSEVENCYSKSKATNAGGKHAEISSLTPQRLFTSAYENLFASLQYKVEIFLDVSRDNLAYSRKRLDSTQESLKGLAVLPKYGQPYFSEFREFISHLEKSSACLRESFDHFHQSFSALKEWSYSLEESSRSREKLIDYSRELLEYTQELLRYEEEFSNYLIGLNLFTMEYRSSLQEKFNLSEKNVRRLRKASKDLTKLNKALLEDPRISSRKEITSKQIAGYF